MKELDFFFDDHEEQQQQQQLPQRIEEPFAVKLTVPNKQVDFQKQSS